ncbi:Fur family transcriptional regulator [Deefgea piscis]|uniref:Fur family transcriptional regulator n=1 Tax=Deefgea piscis TaxID=2739061 RepID=UPI001C827FA1|nr:Fur family transcriptional regulator [Deefgea piscis]QZA81364.1 transcriptional repressor [Deefgea piscis]
MNQTAQAQASELIKQTRARVTAARVNILAVLLTAQRPLSHQDVLTTLDPDADRVTVYRVLDWLTDMALAHKLAGDDRVWRFSVASKPHQHAHFQCTRCGRFYCLEHVSTDLSLTVPAQFLIDAVEITVKGVCASCLK